MESRMILVDTSVWIEVFAGRVRPSKNDFLKFATCGPIIQEVQQGLRLGKQRSLIQWQMLGLPRLGDPLSADLFVEAADLYSECRQRGLTVRSSIDCLIAAIAIRHRVPVWHRDRDFGHIATITSLRVRAAL